MYDVIEAAIKQLKAATHKPEWLWYDGKMYKADEFIREQIKAIGPEGPGEKSKGKELRTLPKRNEREKGMDETKYS